MSDPRPKRLGRSETRSDVIPAPETAFRAAEDTAIPSLPETIAPTATAATVELPPTPPDPTEAQDVAEDAWTVFAESQASLARGFQEITAEMTGITRSGFAASTDAAIALLGARTFSEAVEINADLTRRGFDTMVAGAAKLSEIGIKSLTEASRPFLSRFGAT